MDLDTLIITAFVTIDDAYLACVGSQRLRQRGPHQRGPHQRGPQPLLCDSEVLTADVPALLRRL